MQWRIDLAPDGTTLALDHSRVTQLLRQLGQLRAQRLTDVQFVEDDQQWYAFALTDLPGIVGIGEALSAGQVQRQDAVATEVTVIQQMGAPYRVIRGREGARGTV